MVYLISSLGKKIGMGHSMRCNYLKDAIQKSGINATQLDLTADQLLDYDYFSNKIGDNQGNNIFIFDLHHIHIYKGLHTLFADLKKSNNFLIGLDCLIELSSYLDYLWIPTLFIEQKKLKKIACDYRFGFNSILLPSISNKKYPHNYNEKVLTICSGAGDVCFLGDWLLDEIVYSAIKNLSKIIWIQGPYAKEPVFSLAKDLALNIEIIKSPISLISIMQQSDFVLSVYGVTAFEAMSCKVPTMVFSPYGNKDIQNLNALKELSICEVSLNKNMLVSDLKNFIENTKKHLDIIYNLEQVDFSTGLTEFVELVTKKII